jgi:dTDP-4-amino-4,6-dideoxygalactose transaminase
MIPITRPLLGEEEAEAIRQVVLSGWVTQGPKVAEFEQAFARFAGAAHACALSSGTAALHLALFVAGVRPGDVVATVSHSFIATANAIRLCGAEPVFVDISPHSWCIDPEELHRLLDRDFEPRADGYYYRHVSRIAVGESPLTGLAGGGRLAAILPVHQMGFPAEMGRVLELGGRYGVPVVEDAACAVGSVLTGAGGSLERVGRPHGRAACFSFHPRKLLTTGDGGMITCNDDRMDARFRSLRHHGMDVSDEERHRAEEVVVERYTETALNYRMTDLQAAMGLVQLGKLEENISGRRKLVKLYAELLEEVPGLHLPSAPDGTLPNWQSLPLRLGEEAPLTRLELMRRLLGEGIASRPGIMNAHQEAPYRAAGWQLPRSEEAREQVLLLPLFTGMGEESVEQVAAAIRRAFGG